MGLCCELILAEHLQWKKSLLFFAFCLETQLAFWTKIKYRGLLKFKTTLGFQTGSSAPLS